MFVFLTTSLRLITRPSTEEDFKSEKMNKSAHKSLVQKRYLGWKYKCGIHWTINDI